MTGGRIKDYPRKYSPWPILMNCMNVHLKIFKSVCRSQHLSNLALKFPVVLLAVFILMPSFVHAGWYNSNWQYRKAITIDYTKVTTNLTGFPVLISITDTDLRDHAQSDGDDILYTSSNGTTKLSHEIEQYTSSSGKLVAWVKTDLSSTSDTVLYMYYGNGSASSQQDVSNVWDSNYVAVYHLKESPDGTPDEIKDSTSNNNHGITVGGMSSTDLVDAKIGKGLDLDGSPDVNGDRIEVPDSESLDVTADEATIQLWIWWQNVADGDHQLVMTSSNRYTTGAKDGFEWASQGTGNHFFYPWGGNDSNYNITNGSPFTNQTWHHAVITLKNTTLKDVDLYVDGSLVAWTTENVPTYWTQLANTANWLWGGNPDRLTRQFEGIFDEIRVSDVRRSTGWIQTEYNNQNSPYTFYDIGVETLIELSSFTAKPLNSRVLLEWKTETELDTEGFNILRSEEEDGEYVKINPYLIPSKGLAGFGAEYSFADYDVENGVTYYYLLEDVDMYGKSSFHGPVRATPNDIMLIWPIEWEPLYPDSSIFSWSCSHYSYFKVEISANPTFPDSETISFPEEGWIFGPSLWLSPKELAMIHRAVRESGGKLF